MEEIVCPLVSSFPLLVSGDECGVIFPSSPSLIFVMPPSVLPLPLFPFLLASFVHIVLPRLPFLILFIFFSPRVPLLIAGIIGIADIFFLRYGFSVVTF